MDGSTRSNHDFRWRGAAILVSNRGQRSEFARFYAIITFRYPRRHHLGAFRPCQSNCLSKRNANRWRDRTGQKSNATCYALYLEPRIAHSSGLRIAHRRKNPAHYTKYPGRPDSAPGSHRGFPVTEFTTEQLTGTRNSGEKVQKPQEENREYTRSLANKRTGFRCA